MAECGLRNADFGGVNGFSDEQSHFGVAEVGGKRCGRRDLPPTRQPAAPENKAIWPSQVPGRPPIWNLRSQIRFVVLAEVAAQTNKALCHKDLRIPSPLRNVPILAGTFRNFPKLSGVFREFPFCSGAVPSCSAPPEAVPARGRTVRPQAQCQS